MASSGEVRGAREFLGAVAEELTTRGVTVTAADGDQVIVDAPGVPVVIRCADDTGWVVATCSVDPGCGLHPHVLRHLGDLVLRVPLADAVAEGAAGIAERVDQVVVRPVRQVMALVDQEPDVMARRVRVCNLAVERLGGVTAFGGGVLGQVAEEFPVEADQWWRQRDWVAHVRTSVAFPEARVDLSVTGLTAEQAARVVEIVREG